MQIHSGSRQHLSRSIVYVFRISSHIYNTSIHCSLYRPSHHLPRLSPGILTVYTSVRYSPQRIRFPSHWFAFFPFFLIFVRSRLRNELPNSMHEIALNGWRQRKFDCIFYIRRFIVKDMLLKTFMCFIFLSHRLYIKEIFRLHMKLTLHTMKTKYLGMTYPTQFNCL